MLRKATISFDMSVCLSVRMEQLSSHWMDFYHIWILSILRNSVEKIQVSLKSDKGNGNFHMKTHACLYHFAEFFL
jgi:hypothetical protein